MKKIILKDLLKVERGADIAKMEAPIPVTVGEGFSFELDGKKYVTKGSYDGDKRNVTFRVTSFIGLCAEAVHYYCSVKIMVSNQCGTSSVSGYLGGIQIPNEYESIEAKIVRPLTPKDLEDTDRWGHFRKPGDLVEAFESLDDLNKCIKKVRKFFPSDKWNVNIQRLY